MFLFPEERLSADVLPGAWRYWARLIREIDKGLRPYGVWGLGLGVHFKLTNEEITDIMATKGKGKNGTSGGLRGSNGSGGTNARWVNINLSEHDKEVLSGQSDDLAPLAAVVLDVIAHGGSFGIKPMDSGDSVMAYFIGQPPSGDGQSVGLSAYASTGHDALLCLCYKFDVLCSGQFPEPTLQPDNGGRRFR